MTSELVTKTEEPIGKIPSIVEVELQEENNVSFHEQKAFERSLIYAQQLCDIEPRYKLNTLQKELTLHAGQSGNASFKDDSKGNKKRRLYESATKESESIIRAITFLQAAGRMATPGFYHFSYEDPEVAFNAIAQDWQKLQLLRDIPGDMQASFAKMRQSQILSLGEVVLTQHLALL